MRYQHASEMRSELMRLKRDTDSGRILSSGSGKVQEPTAEPTTRSAAAPPSAGLVLKRYIVLAVCFALLAAAFVAYRFSLA